MLVYRRCRFIVDENKRLVDGCKMLEAHDLDSFGKEMYASHEGLSRDYEVSCPESDFLVNEIKQMQGVKGARQMGGGFGGCTITLVEKKDADEFMQNIRSKYESRFGKFPDCYITNISEGAHMIGPKA